MPGRTEVAGMQLGFRQPKKGVHMQRCVCLFALLLVGISMVSMVQAQTARIGFSSERGTTGLDLWVSDEDGDPQSRMSNESADALRPSYAHNGVKVFCEVNGDIWVRNTSGSPSATNLSANFSPCNGSPVCKDPDAGPVINGDGDYLVVFTRESVPDTTGDIYVATYDVSANALVDPVQLAGTSLIEYHPAWCGSDHVVYSRELGCGNPCPASPLYWWELCVVEIDEPANTTCYFSNIEHAKAYQHPSCDSTGRFVAFARSAGDLKDEDIYVEQPHQVCTMDLEAQAPEDSVDCLDFASCPNDTQCDDTNPVWSDDDDEIAFASDRTLNGTNDFELYKINYDLTGSLTPVTNNSAPDNYPDWGPPNQ